MGRELDRHRLHAPTFKTFDLSELYLLTYAFIETVRMLFEIAVALPVLLLGYILFRKDPEPLLGIYSQPGKWFLVKKALSFAFLTIRKYQMARIKKGSSVKSPDSVGYGMKSKIRPEDMDGVQTLLDDPMAIDCMYFNGLNANGDYVLLRIARRHNREAEIWLYANFKDIGFFQSPVHPDTTLYNTDSTSYSAGGLKFECLEPMRKWKVTFNGVLRKGLCETWPPETGEMTHVKFSFLWNSFTDPFDFDTDIYPGCLASAISREKWSKEYFEALKKSHQTHYEQWGELFGTVEVEGHDIKNLALRGYRDHSYGVRDWNTFHRYAINFAYFEDGTALHVDSLSMPGLLSLLQCGYMSRPNAVMHPVSSTDMDMIALGENQNPPTEYEFNFVADGQSYHVKVKAHTVIKFYLHDDWRSMIFEQVSDYEMNGVKGYGTFEFLYRNPRRSPVHQELPLPLLTEPDITVGFDDAVWLPFTESACTSSRLVGGKGCQLALLTSLESSAFSVPSGFCLTTHAFNLHIENTPALQQAVSHVVKASCTNDFKPSSLQSACEQAANVVQQTAICPVVKEAIAEALTKVFGQNYDQLLVAVRSSAAGEDGLETSAAGQMETVLGVAGLDQIYKAIQQCWASLYAYTAVAYRRQNGLLIQTSAGVVIQRMVPAKAAGVLFTVHPVTGNPGEMMLNVNYGLGQSVVSGESEPDQITVSRNWDDKLAIENKQIGRKNLYFELTSTGIQNITTENRDECCVDDDVILKLAAIGIDLEKRFSNPRDIEFAVDNKNHIHLLQARPVTTLDFESEWSLLHEFDGALASDKEVLTTANIQEMMPGAMTPLTISTFAVSIDQALQGLLMCAGVQPNQHPAQKAVVISCNQAFLNMNFACGLYEGTNALGQKRMAELSLLGEVVDNPPMHEMIAYNGQFPWLKRVWNAVRYMKIMSNANQWIKGFDCKLEAYNYASKSWKSAYDLYRAIDKDVPILSEMWTSHVLSSSSSATWSSVLMVIITKKADVWKTEHYTDLAMLLSKCEDVYSADVPSQLRKLAEHCQADEFREKMLNLTPEEALDWLRSKSSGKIGEEFAVFLQRHGHRCIREAEFREKSWQMEPTKVIEVVQKMLKSSVASSSTKHVERSKESSISMIKSDTTLFSRFFLRLVLPKARKGVGHREISKSTAIKLSDLFKQGYWKLAEMMVQESRLPDRDLLFFLTHSEIGKLLKTRSAKLISRAQKRRQILSKQSSLRFPLLMRGHPTAIENVSPSHNGYASTKSSLKVSGLPVSLGMVTGKARVVKSLSDASSIQNGDVLIVEYTDVGWSPYFPMISGLVTEIGGLLSHGAVVAREYGLPCVVNVQKATELFCSGDNVILNGTLGTVEKLAEDE